MNALPVEPVNVLLDTVLHHEAVHEGLLSLADSVHAPNRLRLHRRVQERLDEDDVLCLCAKQEALRNASALA